MFPAPSRRDFLQIVLGTAAAASMPSLARAQAHHAPLTATKLSDSLLLISGAGGNVVVASAPDGLAMINAGQPDRSADLLTLVAEHSGGTRVTTLVNTDWCADHTGSNEALGKAGALIVAHEHTKQYLSLDRFVEWQERTHKAKHAPGLPTRTFYTKDAITVGAERVELGHLGQAHTDGDIYAFFSTSNVLVVGDVMTVGRYPIPDYTTGGWLGGMVTATKTLLDLSNADTRIVPGTGPVQTRADLQAQFEMLNAVRERLPKMMRQGLSANDMFAAGVTKDFDATWGDSKQFLAVAYRGLWLHVRELGGIV
jgi:cyclase